MTRAKIIFIILIAIIVGIQYVDVEISNPPVTGDIEAPMAVKTILQKSCYDCHSNETKWPWYSKIAPVSWFIADDVNEGRKSLNFSYWERLTTDKQQKLLLEIIEEIEKDEMPLGAYTLLHPGARLDLMQKEVLKKWLKE